MLFVTKNLLAVVVLDVDANIAVQLSKKGL